MPVEPEPTFTQAPVSTGKGSNQLFIDRETDRRAPVQPSTSQETFIEAPISTGKGSDRMFIGREGDVKPTVSTSNERVKGGSGSDRDWETINVS